MDLGRCGVCDELNCSACLTECDGCGTQTCQGCLAGIGHEPKLEKPCSAVSVRLQPALRFANRPGCAADFGPLAERWPKRSEFSQLAGAFFRARVPPTLRGWQVQILFLQVQCQVQHIDDLG